MDDSRHIAIRTECQTTDTLHKGQRFHALTSGGRAEKLKFLCHSDQFGETMHLVHYLSAMDLNCDLASPEFRRNLLIEHSRSSRKAAARPW